MRIQHNIMAMNAYRNYNNNTRALSGNLEKLSSGYKINRAGDDAAGLAISEKMRAQITGLEAAQKNVKDGISLVKTAEGAMQEIQDMLNRMDYLATQSANGTYQDEVDREALQKEVNQLKDEINRIADSANFNGIKLLDGSQAAKQAVDASKIEASGAGVQLIDSAGTKRVQVLESTSAPTISKGAEGATVNISVGLSDGTTVQKTYTFAKNKDGELKDLVDEDGNVVTSLATEKTVAADELDKLVEDVFAKNEKLSSNFDYAMDTSGTKYTATAKETGADTLEIKSFDIQALDTDGKAMTTTTTKYGVQNATAGLDDGFEIDASKITMYDGTNADKAIFEINGHKFVLMTGDMQYTEGSDEKHTSMNATSGLGSDVTILISDKSAVPDDAGITTATNGLMKLDKNFEQNIKKIAEVTGLTVTDAIDEVDGAGNAAATGVGPGEGIRLSKGKSTEAEGGLVLQIGDTADSFNQLRVSIGDMHCKALGIDGLSIANREDAAAAIDTIKNAINQVSSVRGDLGAYQNRLDHTANNLSVMAENIQDAESTIRDTDVAEEMMSYVKNNILVQSAQAMLAQANQVPQGVLQLLG